MNKKLIAPIIVGIVVLIGLGVFVVLSGDDTKNNQKTLNANSSEHRGAKSEAEHYKVVQACDLFTPSEAKSALDATAKKVDVVQPSSTNEYTANSCGYRTGGADFASGKLATVVVRSAKNKTATETIQTRFKTNAGGTVTANAVAVDGLGEKAYWKQSTGQLNILEEHGHQWITITYGGSDINAYTLDDAKAVADKVVD